MRLILAAVLFLGACGDDAKPTLRDYAEDFGRLVSEHDAACGRDPKRGTLFADRFCAVNDTSPDFLDCAEPIEFDFESCEAAFLSDSAGCLTVGMPEDCPSCGFLGVPDECRAMWALGFHG